MRRVRTKPIYVVLAAAVTAMIVMPIAFAGASDSPQATASASVKKQLKKLKKRIAALEGQGGPNVPDTLPPSGPAGGDLTGQYPNPTIGPKAVGNGELEDNAVNNQALTDESVGTAEIQGSAVTGNKMALDSVGSLALAADGVGSSELKGLTARVSPAGTGLNNNTPGDASVTCNPGEMVVGGGYAWTQDETNSIIANAPSESDPNQTWVVRGMPTGGDSNTLFAWANCLAV